MDISSPSIERIAAWAAMPWLHAGFSTRQGIDTLTGPVAEQNLGWTADAADTAAAHRARFLELATDGDAMQLVTLQQVHGCAIHAIDREPASCIASVERPSLKGDGLVTKTSGLMLGIITADCVPVLVADPRRRAVAAFHAGWRGTVACIIEQGMAALQANYGSAPGDLVAAIGPSIGPCCFEVGEEVRTRFVEAFSYADALITSSAPDTHGEPKSHVDLQEANRRQLIDAGLRPGNISVVHECTACTRLPDGRRKYFSYRAENGVTGRMLSVIGVSSGRCSGWSAGSEYDAV